MFKSRFQQLVEVYCCLHDAYHTAYRGCTDAIRTKSSKNVKVCSGLEQAGLESRIEYTVERQDFLYSNQ